MVTPVNPSAILITGAMGYVGRHLQTHLPNALFLDRKLGSELNDFNPRDPRWQGIQHVIHLADRRLQDINKDNLSENIQGHRDFLQKIAELPNLKKVLFSSSCSVYGFSAEEITDHSTVNPTSFYADSKLSTEQVLKDLQIPHTVFRFGTAYGWSPEMREDLFINQVARAAVFKEKMQIYSPEAWRPYVHCKDFSEVLAGGLNLNVQGPLNIVTENFTKNQILALSALKPHGFNPEVVPESDPRNYRVRVHAERLSSLTKMDDGLQEMLRNYKNA